MAAPRKYSQKHLHTGLEPTERHLQTHTHQRPTNSRHMARINLLTAQLMGNNRAIHRRRLAEITVVAIPIRQLNHHHSLSQTTKRTRRKVWPALWLGGLQVHTEAIKSITAFSAQQVGHGQAPNSRTSTKRATSHPRRRNIITTSSTAESRRLHRRPIRSTTSRLFWFQSPNLLTRTPTKA
jgi:hypothetical protein